MRNKLQKHLSLKFKKIYPLSLCEIRVLEIKTPIKKEEKTKEKAEKKEK